VKKHSVKKSSVRGKTRRKNNLAFFVILFLAIITASFTIAYLKVSSEEHDQLNAQAASSEWKSGASCEGVPDGSFASWRGSPTTISGTWNDGDVESQTNQWTMGIEYKNWNQSVDDSIGAFWGSGSSWSKAAGGSYDTNLHQALAAINANWGNKKTVYIRYGHEFNGDWYPWKVTAADNASYIKAFDNFYNMVQTDLVAKGRDAKVVWSPNNDEHNGINTELNWPGDKYVDVVGVDFYDGDLDKDQATWDRNFNKTGAYGGPAGVGSWQAFAAKHGKPLAFPEWGTTGEGPVDDPFFIKKMNEFMTANAGTGPGQIAYDVYFNCTGYNNGGGENFQIYPVTKVPQSAAMYKSLKWGLATVATPSATATTSPSILPTSILTPPITIPVLTNTPIPTAIPTLVPSPTPTSAVTPITFKSATTGTNGSSSKTLSLSKPSGVINGDVMIAQVTVSNASTTITEPSGWNLIRTTQSSGSIKMATYYKVASSTEPTSYTWTTNSSQAATGGISAFSGVNKTNPIETSSGKYNDSTATVSFAQVTTAVANDMVLAFVGVSGNTTVTPPSGLTERYDKNNASSSSNGKTVEVSTQLKPATGATNVGNGKEDSLSKSNLTELVVLRAQ